jgi:hypothetical protein
MRHPAFEIGDLAGDGALFGEELLVLEIHALQSTPAATALLRTGTAPPRIARRPAVDLRAFRGDVRRVRSSASAPPRGRWSSRSPARAVAPALRISAM